MTEPYDIGSQLAAASYHSGKLPVTPARARARIKNLLFPWLICALGGLFYCYEYLLRVSPSVMASQVTRFFHTDAAGFGVLAGSYYYIYALMQLFVGVLIDSYGPRRLMSLACICCAAGVALFAATPYYWVALLGRFLIGFGSAFAFVGVMKLAATWLPQRFFALISGITTMLGMLGGILGDLILTALVRHAGWRASCFYAALIGLILALAIFVVIKRAREHYLHRKMPKQLPSLRHNFSQVLSLLRKKHLWFNGIIAGCLYMSLPVFADTWGIPYLTQGLHFSASTAALMCSSIYLGWAVGGPIMGWLTDYLQYRRPIIMLGLVLSFILIAALLLVSKPHAWWVFMACFALGICSSVQVISFAVARDMTSVQYTGSAVAITNMLIMSSGWFVALTGVVLTHLQTVSHTAGIVHYTQKQYDIALSILPLALLLAVFVLLRLPETHPTKAKDAC